MSVLYTYWVLNIAYAREVLKKYLTSSHDFKGLFWHKKCVKLNTQSILIVTIIKKTANTTTYDNPPLMHKYSFL